MLSSFLSRPDVLWLLVKHSNCTYQPLVLLSQNCRRVKWPLDCLVAEVVVTSPCSFWMLRYAWWVVSWPRPHQRHLADGSWPRCVQNAVGLPYSNNCTLQSPVHQPVINRIIFCVVHTGSTWCVYIGTSHCLKIRVTFNSHNFAWRYAA